jgi:hypothetical protein
MKNPLSSIISDADYERVKPYVNKNKVKYFNIYCRYLEMRKANPKYLNIEIYRMLANEYNMAYDTIRKIQEKFK